MSAAGLINAGGRITASEIRGVAPTAGYKTADQTVTSSTTLVSDTALVVPVAANAVYWFMLTVLYKGGTLGAADLKPGWLVPSGTTLAGSTSGLGTGSTAVLAGYVTQAAWNPVAFGTDGGSINLSFTVVGVAVTSATAGNLQFQWAQNTSSATATTVMKGSSLAAWQIA